MIASKNPFRLNVGYIVHETPGYTSDFSFDIPHLAISPDLHLDQISGNILISRTQKGLLLEGTFVANTTLDCVRCLDEFSGPVNIDFTELYAFHERSATESDLFVPDTGIIDLQPLIHEFMQLGIPNNPLCKSDCAGLCPICGTNHNHENCDCETDTIDPRLAKLKDLLEDDEQ